MTGARKFGKSTLLKHIAQSQGKYYQYINFDDPLQLAQASNAIDAQSYRQDRVACLANQLYVTFCQGKQLRKF